MKAIKYYVLIVLFGMSLSASCQARADAQSRAADRQSVEALP